ncbi:Telomere length regulation protein TEL2-like protein, partial [Trichoplax sp. H2]
ATSPAGSSSKLRSKMDSAHSIAQSEVYSIVAKVIRQIQNTDDQKEWLQGLQEFNALLTGVAQSPLQSNLNEIKMQFTTRYYTMAANAIIKTYAKWSTKITAENRVQYLDHFFLKGPCHEAFLSLSNIFNTSSHSLVLRQGINLLDQFIQVDRIRDLICSFSLVKSKEMNDLASATLQNNLYERIISDLASLPERIANKLELNIKSNFYPKSYFQRIAQQIDASLKLIYEFIKDGHSYNLTFLGNLLGKITMIGHADTIFYYLLPSWTINTKQNNLWQSVIQKLLCTIPDSSLENILITLLTTIKPSLSPNNLISRLLGNNINESSKLRFLFTKKFLLLRSFKNLSIPKNIISYLHLQGLQSLLSETFLEVLDAWCKKSAIQYTGYEEHLYLSQVLLILCSHLDKKEVISNQQAVLVKLLHGMQVHLENNTIQIRRLGMIVGETLTDVLDNGGNRLRFEYEENDETDEIKALQKRLPKLQDGELEHTISKYNLDEQEGNKHPKDTLHSQGRHIVSTLEESSSKVATTYEELDSDDDFESYDMSNDTVVNKIKKPSYIRDCIEGLLVNDDPHRVDVCLHTIESLVKRNPSDLPNLAEEIVKILLHLQNESAAEDYNIVRLSAMISTTVQCPTQAVKYLTTEFYKTNYSLQQRLDILEIIAKSAQELSSPHTTDSESKKEAIPSDNYGTGPQHRSKTPNWQQIVNERIKLKTRRFAKGRPKSRVKSIANRFAPVAGLFFFPLLQHFDRPLNTMDLLGDDSFVLGRLIYTLGVVLYAAINTTIVDSMGKSLLEFLWAVRFHEEAYIRQSIIFSFTMIILSLPSYVLIGNADIYEFQAWMQDLIHKDPNSECRKLAAQSLSLLQDTFKKELLPEEK